MPWNKKSLWLFSKFAIAVAFILSFYSGSVLILFLVAQHLQNWIKLNNQTALTSNIWLLVLLTLNESVLKRLTVPVWFCSFKMIFNRRLIASSGFSSWFRPLWSPPSDGRIRLRCAVLGLCRDGPGSTGFPNPAALWVVCGKSTQLLNMCLHLFHANVKHTDFI